MKNKFILVLSNNFKSVLYLKSLLTEKLIPEIIIHLNDGSKNKYYKELKKNFFKLKIKTFKANELNQTIIKYILRKKISYLIFSLYRSTIIKNAKLLKKKIIHSHNGKLPLFRGSTTIFYSLLKKKKIYSTTFILNKDLDRGEILYIKKYNVPKNIYDIECKFDTLIRIQNIIYVLKNLHKIKPKKKKNKSKLETLYYVIHPVLKSIVYEKFKNKINK